MDELVLSKEDFKAFSSDTRVKIAKLLKERNYTLSELSKKLGMASPTVKTHLDKLAGASIVEQRDEGRKWKYYSLTRKGRKILEPEARPMIMLVIGVAAVLLVGTIFMLSQSMQFAGIGFQSTGGTSMKTSSQATEVVTGAPPLADNTAAQVTEKAQNTDIGLIFLAILLAFILGYFVARERTGRGKQW